MKRHFTELITSELEAKMEKTDSSCKKAQEADYLHKDRKDAGVKYTEALRTSLVISSPISSSNCVHH